MAEEQQQKSVRIDAWMMEMEESSKLIESLELKHENFMKQSMMVVPEAESTALLSRIENADSMVYQLWLTLDRLDSLLKNPPSLPVLADEDLKSRCTMLSDIRQRTSALVHSLPALAATYRIKIGCESELGEISQLDSIGTSHGESADLLAALMSDWYAESDIQLKPERSRSLTVKTCLLKSGWAILYFVGGVALLYLLLVIVAALQAVHPN